MRSFAVLTLLQILHIGGVILDGDLSVVQSNEVARRRADGELGQHPTIKAIRPYLHSWFPQRGSSDSDEKCFVVEKPGRRPLVVFCTPIWKGTQEYIAIAFIDFNYISVPENSILRSLFRLTNAEAEVAKRVAQGRSTAEIAAEIGSARGTVRVQLKSAFAKTRTKRQSELAAILGRTAFIPNQKSPIIHLILTGDSARELPEIILLSDETK